MSFETQETFKFDPTLCYPLLQADSDYMGIRRAGILEALKIDPCRLTAMRIQFLERTNDDGSEDSMDAAAGHQLTSFITPKTDRVRACAQADWKEGDAIAVPVTISRFLQNSIRNSNTFSVEQLHRTNEIHFRIRQRPARPRWH